MPRVTVVIPAYNSEAYIADAVSSVRDQTLTDVEVIVVDDGSTDGTLSVLEPFRAVMDLHVIAQRNAGPAAARNAGVRAARAPYCAFLDADDVMLPDRLAAQCALLEADDELGLVHSDLMTFDAAGIIHRTRRAFSDPCGGWALDRLLLDNFITTSTVMAPKARLVEAGLFDERRRLSEDFDLWLRIAARWKIAFIERPLVRYRHRPGSLSSDKLETSLAALDVLEAFWRDHPEHAARDPALHRRSLAAHLRTAGTAALARGRRAAAAGYLLRSLRGDVANRYTWKQIAKLVLPRRTRPSSARKPPAHDAATT